MSIATSRVTVTARDKGKFDAYLAVPASGRGPGLVLIQEIFGVNGYMRSVADGYAARGFTVICPDLFWRQQPGVELTDRSDEEWQQGISLMRGMDEAMAAVDCAAAMGFLRSHAACSGRVGALGFCLGGRLAWLLAVREDPDATVGYYGVGIESLLGEKHGLRAPLMLHIAGRDAHCPPEARTAIVEGIGGNPLVTLHTWADQDHAFSRPSGRHYDSAAAELADLRTLDFLCRHLSGPGPGLSAIWDEHVACEFAVRDTERTLATMVEDAYVNHVPVLTGGVGKEALRDFYSSRFIPKMPPDTSMTPVSRTIGSDRVVDEMIFRFTHTLEMDWMLPGIAPTGRRVEVPLVVIVHFRGGRLAHEHIYWDQGTVLAQIGLLDATRLPVSGVESARKVLDPASVASNELIARASGRRGGSA